MPADDEKMREFLEVRSVPDRVLSGRFLLCCSCFFRGYCFEFNFLWGIPRGILPIGLCTTCEIGKSEFHRREIVCDDYARLHSFQADECCAARVLNAFRRFHYRYILSQNFIPMWYPNSRAKSNSI